MEKQVQSDFESSNFGTMLAGMRMTRRRFSVVATAALGATLLAACGGDDDDDDDTGSTDSDATEEASSEATDEVETEAETEEESTSESEDSTATEEGSEAATETESEEEGAATEEESAPTRGGTLVYARNIDAQTLDPHFSAQLSERYILYLVFNTLVAYDVDFSLVPDLAESWEFLEDGTQIIFTLRENVTFHDGTPCDAEAVKWNFDRVMDPEVNSPMRSQLAESLDTVEVIDPVTVQLNLTQAWRPIMASLGERPGFVVSPAAVEEYGDTFGRNPVGSGPYRFVEWTTDSRIVVEAFEDYWDEGMPYLDQIEIRHVPDGQVQLTMIRTGEAQLIDNVSPSLLQTVQGAEGVVVEEFESARFTGTVFDVDKPPFDNADLRKAFAYATNREEILQVIYAGAGRVATHPIGGGWAYNPDFDGQFYTFDLEKAKEHLALAGAEGQSFTFTAPNTPESLQIAQLLQAQYQQLDVSIDIETVNAADAYQMVLDDETNWTVSSRAPRADPDGAMRVLWHSEGFQNSTGYNNPEVDELLDRAAGIYDTDEAKEVYNEAERIITETSGHIFHIFTSEYAARREEVQGFVFHPDLILRLREFSLSS